MECTEKWNDCKHILIHLPSSFQSKLFCLKFCDANNLTNIDVFSLYSDAASFILSPNLTLKNNLKKNPLFFFLNNNNNKFF